MTKLASGTDWYPQWSPDGVWIVFQRHTTFGGRYALYRVRADGDSMQAAVPVYTDSLGKLSTYDAATPSYSPDGKVILAGIGPNVQDLVFTHTLDPSFAPIPAIRDYAEAQFAARYIAAFPILGPLLSPDGTRLEIGAKQVWATRRNMPLPPRITSVTWLNGPQTTSINDTTVVYAHASTYSGTNQYRIDGTDAEGDTLWWWGDVKGPGMSFDSTTRILSFLAPESNKDYYGRVRVSERSGGSDFLILKLRVQSGGGLASEPAREEAGEAVVGPNPTRGRFVFPAPTFAGPVTVAVFDVAGREVARLRSRPGSALTWDGTGPDGARVPAGIYLYRMEAGRQRSYGKIAVIR